MRARTLSVFSARVRTGAYGHRRQVAVGIVFAALTAIGQMIKLLDTGINPIKSIGSDRNVYPIKVVVAGWEKIESPTTKKLPIEVDIPKLLVKMAAA